MKLNDLDLNKLHTFFAVLESGSVTGAGRALGRTGSAVSQSLSSLERALGLRLFDRVGKRLVLTRPGQLLAERFRVYHAMLARTVAELANEGDEARGLVRIGLFLGFPRPRFADFAHRFIARFPEVVLRVVYAAQEDLKRRLLRNRLDFVFSFRPRSEADSGLVSTRLFEQELLLSSGPGFFRRGFDLAELTRTPVIDYYQGDPLIDRWLVHHFPSQRVEVGVHFWAATTDLVLELMLRNAGVGVLPRELVHPHLGRRRLKVLRPEGLPLTDFVWLVEPRGAYRDGTLVAFRSAVLEEFA